MISPEHYYAHLPSETPRFIEDDLVDPNDGAFPTDATVHVWTEDAIRLEFAIYPKGPAEKDYLISLMKSEPPLFPEGSLYPKEVYVKGDVLVKNEVFILDSPFPVLSKTAFKAMRIFSNYERISTVSK